MTKIKPQRFKIETDDRGGQHLLCAHCESDLTHTTNVQVQSKPGGEYADQVINDQIDSGCGTNYRHLQSKEIGRGRRQAVAITYQCEICDHLTQVWFVQHKGTTQIEVVDLGVLVRSAHS